MLGIMMLAIESVGAGCDGKGLGLSPRISAAKCGNLSLEELRLCFEDGGLRCSGEEGFGTADELAKRERGIEGSLWSSPFSASTML